MDFLTWCLDLVTSPTPEVLFGFIGGLFGGKPKKPKESENDKALASISRGQMNRYSGKFSPLLGKLDGLAQQDKSETLRGRGNADMMQNLGGARAPGQNGQMGSIERAGTRALGSSLTSGTNAAVDRSSTLTKGVMGAATGAGQEAIQGLGVANQLATSQSIRKMNADASKGQLWMDALGAAAGGAAATYANSDGGGGTDTRIGTSARTAYNVDMGKGGMGSGGFVSNSRFSGQQRYLGAQGF